MSLRVVCISLREYYVVVSYTLMRSSLQPSPQSLSMLECEQLGDAVNGCCPVMWPFRVKLAIVASTLAYSVPSVHASCG